MPCSCVIRSWLRECLWKQGWRRCMRPPCCSSAAANVSSAGAAAAAGAAVGGRAGGGQVWLPATSAKDCFIM